MKYHKWVITIILSFVSVVIIAAEARWTKGYGQGNLEFFIDKGNARLYITCPSQESNNGGYAKAMLFVDNKEVNSFKIKTTGQTYDGPFDSGTRNGENNIISLIDDLNKANAKVTYKGNTIVFPKTNIASSLPTFRSGKLNCAFN